MDDGRRESTSPVEDEVPKSSSRRLCCCPCLFFSVLPCQEKPYLVSGQAKTVDVGLKKAASMTVESAQDTAVKSHVMDAQRLQNIPVRRQCVGLQETKQTKRFWKQLGLQQQ